MQRRLVPSLLGLAALLALPAQALAHSPPGLAPMTLSEGLTTGLLHPLLGLDHLAFLVAAGVLAASLPRRDAVRTLLAFPLAGLIGGLLPVAGISLAAVELGVALSVLLAGIALLATAARPIRPSPGWLAAGFALSGLFHGHAHAEAIAMAGAAATVTFLAALTVSQAAIAGGVMVLARRASGGAIAAPAWRRWTGLAATVVGVAALAGALA